MPGFSMPGSIAVALSGGSDSMALAWLLAQGEDGPDIHALTVDHGLRPGSAEEARQAGAWVKGWPRVRHTILTWQGDKPEARIMEEARKARYRLLADECRAQGIRHLFAAHHQDDQAETFLIRLTAGSGLDGLGGMRPVQPAADGVLLVRPLLAFPKDRLIATCRANFIPYVEDPSNAKAEYKRPRLRAARQVLEEEGLTAKRLAVTAARLSRARAALEGIAGQAFGRCLSGEAPDGLTFDFPAFQAEAEEIRLRILLMALDRLRPDADYAPRMEKTEELLAALDDPAFKSRTLGGCLFAIRDKGRVLWIGKE